MSLNSNPAHKFSRINWEINIFRLKYIKERLVKKMEKTTTKSNTSEAPAKSRNAGSPFKKEYSLIAAPFAVIVTIFCVYIRFGFFPFGSRTVAWADMNQQVVPLLCQFKDILDGKGGMLLSFKNSGGMNFWGVFFFFLASPFSLLVKFIRKENMLLFMNILVVVKMMFCSASACFYFIKSKEHRSLGAAEITLLGFIYAVCGYTMLFYQNVIWLDVMYLFPLLLLSIEHMFEKKGSLVPYSLLMAATVAVNYYLGYMVVIYVILFMALYAAVLIKRGEHESSLACMRFLVGSGLAALMSAVVWLPSFMQYLTSGRKTSLIENLRSGEMMTDYETVFPVVICSSALLLLAALDLKRMPHKKPSDIHRQRQIMTALMLVPIFLEPINKMWHTGSYMAFPARYAFMTVFMLMILAAYTLGKNKKTETDRTMGLIWTGEGLALAGLFWFVSARFITQNTDVLGVYTLGLNGNEFSFKAFMRLLLLGLIVAVSVYFNYKKGLIAKRAFVLLLAVLTVFETINNSRIYMTFSGIRNEDTYALQREVLDLSDRIEDDSFYRVKTSAKLFDYNMIGAMDYNSLGSYTSLNDQNYLFSMKRLGYTSVWMEIGTCGGTELTDALLGVGYQIDHDHKPDTVYSYDNYFINRNKYRLPLGICLDEVPGSDYIPEELSREDVQRRVSEALLGEDIIEHHDPSEGGYKLSEDGRYSFREGEILVYRIPVRGRKTLYFDCFDRLSTDLSEPIYETFMVQANGRLISSAYPYSKDNGVLKIGTFEDENVTIQLTVLQPSECRSFGVFSVDLDKLGSRIENMRSCDLHEIKNGLEGTADVPSQQTVLLSVPDGKGFTLRVNGEKAEIRESMMGFMAFDIPAGHSDIKLTFRPRGFILGAVTSVLGIAAFAAYCVLKKRRAPAEGAEPTEKQLLAGKVTAYITAGLGILMFVAVYILPIALNIIFWKPEKKI